MKNTEVATVGVSLTEKVHTLLKQVSHGLQIPQCFGSRGSLLGALKVAG